jgi:hypothetical protein
MKWSMISEQTAITNLALDWYKQWPSMVGSAPDTVNRVHCHCPPAELLVGVEEVLLFDHELAETDRPAALLHSIQQAATFMLAASGNVLTGESWLFDEMYHTRYFWLWCKFYPETETARFEDDYLHVFGVVAGATTQEEASQQIKAYFSN